MCVIIAKNRNYVFETSNNISAGISEGNSTRLGRNDRQVALIKSYINLSSPLHMCVKIDKNRIYAFEPSNNISSETAVGNSTRLDRNYRHVVLIKSSINCSGPLHIWVQFAKSRINVFLTSNNISS